MFFEGAEQIADIARKTGSAVFVVPRETAVKIPRALLLAPEEKSVITIEQVREVLARLSMKQVEEQFVVVRPAEALGEEAANAMLKTLEEPGEKVHFVLVTDTPSLILPTILSRSAVYILRGVPDVDTGIMADEKVKMLAKRLMTCQVKELPALAEEICKKKDGVRAYALEVLDAAVQMSYKTYFITGKAAFLARIPKFLEAYTAISRNGHIKLHLVADLI